MENPNSGWIIGNLSRSGSIEHEDKSEAANKNKLYFLSSIIGKSYSKREMKIRRYYDLINDDLILF